MSNQSPKTHHPKLTKAGFTLIETLVAISVLLLSISAPLTIASHGLANARFARDQVTAFYLAQDAVEYIRNLRDKNSLSGVSWVTGFISIDGSPFTIDTIDGDVALCPAGGCPPLEYNATTNFYSYNDPLGVQSIFTRTTTMQTVNAQEIAITVTVSWASGKLSHTFSVKESIFDWQ